MRRSSAAGARDARGRAARRKRHGVGAAISRTSGLAFGLAATLFVTLALRVGAEDVPTPAPPVSPPAAPAPPQATIDQAEQMLRSGDVKGALKALDWLAAQPDGGEDPRIQHALGVARVADGDPRSAVAHLLVAARRRGSNADHLALADALLATAKLDASEGSRTDAALVPAYLGDVLTHAAGVKDPTPEDFARSRRLESEAKRMLGDAAGARDAVLAPQLESDKEAQDLLARALWDLGDFAKAAEAYRRAGSALGVARAYWRAGDPRAADEYARLVTASPADIVLIDEATRAVTAVGKVESLDAVLAAIPATAPVARARGRLAERAGTLTDAVARYREAIALAPEDPDVKSDLGRALVASKPDDAATVDEATGLLLAVLKSRPSDEWARSVLDFIARSDLSAVPREWPDRRRLDRGVTIYRAIADADPSDGTGWSNLGNALRNAGDPSGAVAALRRGVEANPYDAGVQNDLGIACVASLDAAGALEAFQNAIRLDPGDAAARQNAGRLKRLRGDFDGARDDFAAALASTRTVGGHPPMFRLLLDRVWRQRHAGRR